MSKLTDLIPPEAILVGVEAQGWADAIEQAAQPLVRAGAVREAYSQAMIDVVHQHGPYIVIAPGFALAHAQAAELVSETCMSWCNLVTAVEFGHKHDPVDIVVVLAAADTRSHQSALQTLATVLQDSEAMARIRAAESPEELRGALSIKPRQQHTRHPRLGEEKLEATTPTQSAPPKDLAASKGKILTVCGNGLGTSLFLKNTLEQVLSAWGWSDLFSVEATDTISAKGKASDADCILTSGEIAKTLGDLGVPMYVIENFTSEAEVDAALRELYWVEEA